MATNPNGDGKGNDGKGFVSDSQLTSWLGACDPARPLDPSDSRYCDLGWTEVDGQRVELRGDDHIERLLDAIQLRSDEDSTASWQLFSGFSGTGKSTELRRLRYRLESEGYVVLLADAREYHDLGHELTIEDVSILIAGAFGEAASGLLGRDMMKDSYWQQLKNFLGSEVEGEFKLPAGIADLKIGIKHERPFWVKVRESLGLAPGRLRDHSHRFIRRAVEEILERESPCRGVVFVLDSLEKLNAPLPDFQRVMSSLVGVLTDFPEHFQLPRCHAIYTIPPYISLISPHLGDHYRVSEILPAVKVTERRSGADIEPYKPGVDRLVELVSRRLDIEKVFGDRRDLLERLVISSGGHVRMLLRFLTELLIQARSRGLPPDEAAIDRIETPIRQRLENSIRRGSVPLLGRILRRGSLSGLEVDEFAELAQLMEAQVVLSYRNGEGWFEVQPLVREATQRLLAELESE